MGLNMLPEHGTSADSYLHSNGLHQGWSNANAYVFQCGGKRMIVMMYIDDL